MKKKVFTVKYTTVGQQPITVSPIIEESDTMVLHQAGVMVNKKPDMVEWRVDDFLRNNSSIELINLSKKVRRILGNIPLLMTLRTSEEGGMKDVTPQLYRKLLVFFIENQLADVIDIECNTIGDQAAEVVKFAHENGIKTIMTHHDFDETPSNAVMEDSLRQMAATNADVVKLSVMPNSAVDVINLMLVTNKMNDELEVPVATTAMGQIGKMSRIGGLLTGSMLTYASVGKESTPGQINLDQTKQLIKAFSI
ncbi:type I 3-dehydroquinate dehydratase [Fructilactobacillus sp. Tb1]|uniref:type I 3-dehydroquinate dehydratase n=1 Tax=Fructilactobacillus sp. Tb1 TaxID=3422304 RepID=UPI003D2A2C5A